MTILKPLLARNRSWAQKQRQSDPDYFQFTSQPQQPHTLWIGCSDSRVPAEVLTGAHPGELFVHRNIANMVIAEDDNLISVLQYALEYLKVSGIVLCGHYGCGGVQAAVQLPEMPLASEDSALSRRIRHLRHTLQAPLEDFHRTKSDDSERLNQLVEANVLTQFSTLISTAPVQAAWRQSTPLHVFGCVYDLHSGHLKPLVQQSAAGSADYE
ncbi:carbonic anhydrase [Ewingella sp. S1.OA.A_B6]